MFQVMIVDDETSVVEALALTVPWDQLDVEYVHRAESGYEALELLKEHSIDIVITDISMPGMSGLELIDNIRKRWKGTKCIILSGYADFEYAREAIRLKTLDYLLKPIGTEELVKTIRNVQEQLKREWGEINSKKQIADALYENCPLLRSSLLGELIKGRYMDGRQLKERMRLLDIPFDEGDRIAMLIIRPEDESSAFDTDSIDLFEFSIGNITEEIYGEYFKLWNFKDTHGFLVFVIKFQPESLYPELTDEELSDKGKQRLFERLAVQLQKSIRTYLEGRISLLVSNWGYFPGDLKALYDLSISTMRKRIGNDHDFFFTMGDELEETEFYALNEPYKSPTFLNMLEAGNWDAARSKLDLIFNELCEKYNDSSEHILEIFNLISSNFCYVAHQNGRSMSSIAGQDFLSMGRGDTFHSVLHLKNWAFRILSLLKSDMADKTANARASILDGVREYAEQHLAEDVSLVTIADHVHLHPVYLSKVFKLETGETLSDYLFDLKINKAAYLLKHSDLKIYEVARETGYENTYFMKVFKRHFGITPQEYREG